MSEFEFCFADAALTARASGALWWASARTLCVADLHLGKSERIARRGGVLLPPYDTAETLDRLADEIARLVPARVICLGDSFDDGAAAEALGPADATRLTALMAGRDWVWITGNHDPGPVFLGGQHTAAVSLASLTFRHAAEPDAGPGEISGHYHPKVRLTIRGRTLVRSCFLVDARRLILPAFGAYTGGIWSDHPVFRAILDAPARAILTGNTCIAVPAPGLERRDEAPRPRRALKI
jgi:DNA ligase-associated metallophosphoesterase